MKKLRVGFDRVFDQPIVVRNNPQDFLKRRRRWVLVSTQVEVIDSLLLYNRGILHVNGQNECTVFVVDVGYSEQRQVDIIEGKGWNRTLDESEQRKIEKYVSEGYLENLACERAGYAYVAMIEMEEEKMSIPNLFILIPIFLVLILIFVSGNFGFFIIQLVFISVNEFLSRDT